MEEVREARALAASDLENCTRRLRPSPPRLPERIRLLPACERVSRLSSC